MGFCSKGLNLHNLLGEITYEDPSRGQITYPRERWDELQLAVTEAFAWLEAQALIVPQPMTPMPTLFITFLSS